MKSWTESDDDDGTRDDFARFFTARVASGGTPVPEPVLRWLESLSLLEGVPFQMLVPRADILPDNSMRFFYLDENWLFALMDGAISLGRSLTMDLEHDREILTSVFRRVLGGSINVRRRKQGKAALNPADAASGGRILCTGFLLRSVLVRGWRGLEFKAFSDAAGKTELPALRLETLSGDVLFGLHRGVTRRLEIRQPPESFHFGLSDKPGAAGKSYEKMLRSLDTGELLGDAWKVDMPLRGDRGNRVLDMAAAAAGMKKRLGADVTPSEFAVETVQNAYTGIITEKGNSA